MRAFDKLVAVGLTGGLILAVIFVASGCKEKVMTERKGVVTMKGNPLTLLGDEVKLGRRAPDFEVLANDLSTVKLSSFRGKVCVVSSVPSLDTAVCDIMTRRFNEEAGKLGNDVVVLTISMDLPFAQKRWCGAAGVENVQTLSDHREASFGKAFGVLIKELRLLARAVFVVNKDGVVRYIEIVNELTNEPDYDAALKAARESV
jgi:thiol peroxidase